MDDQLASVRRAHLALMERTASTIALFLAPLSQETATTLLDGGGGWSVLEVLCHLRDFDGYFRGCATLMIEQETPHLPGYDPDAIAVAERYNEQELQADLGGFLRSRQSTHAFFSGQTAEQWTRDGIHPVRGRLTMTDAVIQVGHHDTIHLEQIGKILHPLG